MPNYKAKAPILTFKFSVEKQKMCRQSRRRPAATLGKAYCTLLAYPKKIQYAHEGYTPGSATASMPLPKDLRM